MLKTEIKSATSEPARTRGRPRKDRTLSEAQQVERLAAMGFSRTACAAAIGMDRGLFSTRYGLDYSAGALRARARVALVLYDRALNGSTPACRAVLGIDVARDDDDADRDHFASSAWGSRRNRLEQAADNALDEFPEWKRILGGSA